MSRELTLYRKFLGKNLQDSHLLSATIEVNRALYYSRPIFCSPNDFKSKLKIAIEELEEYIKK